MIRRPPRATQSRSSAASDVYKRQVVEDYGITRDALLVLVRIFGKVVSLEYQFEFFFAGATFEA